MDIQSMSDAAIGLMIGHRFEELRLRRNLSYIELCAETGVSRQTLHALLRQGKGNLSTVIAVMRALKDLDSLSSLIATVPISPIQLLKLQGNQRKRASGKRKHARTSTPSAKTKELDW